MTREEAQKWLQSFDGMYLIVGYKPDGYKRIPAKFDTATLTAKDADTVFTMIPEFSDFRVFHISQSLYNADWWRMTAAGKANELTEKEERELLKKLKEKYESQ